MMEKSINPTESLPFLPPDMATLESQLEGKAKKRSNRVQRGVRFVLALLIGYVLMIGFSWLFLFVCSALFVICLPGFPLLLQQRKFEQVKQARSLETLAQWEDPRAVGLLCLAYLHPGNRFREAHRSRLLELLPSLTESDVEHFTLTQRNALHRLLRIGDCDLTLAALTGLAQVGNQSSLSFLETLLKTHFDLPMVEAIQNCAATITARIEQSKLSHTLLRPSASRLEPETLLRPSHETETDPVQLLRPKE